MRAQRFTLLIGILALLLGAWSRPLGAAPTQPPSSFPRFSSPDYDLRARQAEERHLRQEQTAQRHVVAQQRRVWLFRLSQQERSAKEAAARQCLRRSQRFCSRLAEIERAYAQKREQRERALAKEQAQREVALALERELSQLPE